MQDTFLNVSLNIEKYSQTNENLFTWICGIARKLAIDKINTKEFKHSMPNNGVFSTIKSNNQHGNSQVNIDVNNEEIVVRNIYPKYEKVIELIYFQGFTQVKIANELNIPLGMVKEYVRTAIIELRKYLV